MEEIPSNIFHFQRKKPLRVLLNYYKTLLLKIIIYLLTRVKFDVVYNIIHRPAFLFQIVAKVIIIHYINNRNYVSIYNKIVWPLLFAVRLSLAHPSC